jgi:hypothetical protein
MVYMISFLQVFNSDRYLLLMTVSTLQLAYPMRLTMVYVLYWLLGENARKVLIDAAKS